MIECSDLQWGLPGSPLAPALSFSVPGGTLALLSGTNGAGKSTLMRLLAGHGNALAGHCRQGKLLPGHIGWLQQQAVLDRQFPIDVQTLVAAGLLHQRLTRSQRLARTRSVLRYWRLEDLRMRPLAALSGGELQRVLLARLDLQAPRVLLLDEPDSALDTAGQRLLGEALGRWKRQGASLLLATHQPSSYRHLADQWLHLDGPRSGLLDTALLQETAA